MNECIYCGVEAQARILPGEGYNSENQWRCFVHIDTNRQVEITAHGRMSLDRFALISLALSLAEDGPINEAIQAIHARLSLLEG